MSEERIIAAESEPAIIGRGGQGRGYNRARHGTLQDFKKALNALAKRVNLKKLNFNGKEKKPNPVVLAMLLGWTLFLVLACSGGIP